MSERGRGRVLCPTRGRGGRPRDIRVCICRKIERVGGAGKGMGQGGKEETRGGRGFCFLAVESHRVLVVYPASHLFPRSRYGSWLNLIKV